MERKHLLAACITFSRMGWYVHFPGHLELIELDVGDSLIVREVIGQFYTHTQWEFKRVLLYNNIN